MSYSHLSIEQTYDIDALRRAGHAQAEMARVIGVHPSTISRELYRNGCNGRYGAAKAHSRSHTRRSLASSAARKLTPDVCRQINAVVRQEQWSPEQISRRLPVLGLRSVSHETIYLYILDDKGAGGDLYTHLRQSGKKRRKRYGSHDRRGIIPNRRSIDDRPPIVAERSRIGDWEIDTVVGKEHQGALVTLVERKSRLTLIRRVDRATAEDVAEAVAEMTRGYRPRMLTITSDNGREFALPSDRQAGTRRLVADLESTSISRIPIIRGNVEPTRTPTG